MYSVLTRANDCLGIVGSSSYPLIHTDVAEEVGESADREVWSRGQGSGETGRGCHCTEGTD